MSGIVLIDAETWVGSLSHYICLGCNFNQAPCCFRDIYSHVVHLVVTSTSLLPTSTFWGWLRIRKTSISQSWGSDCGFSHWYSVISGWGGGLSQIWGDVTRLKMVHDCWGPSRLSMLLLLSWRYRLLLVEIVNFTDTVIWGLDLRISFGWYSSRDVYSENISTKLLSSCFRAWVDWMHVEKQDNYCHRVQFGV